jgi:hypothetical protein
MPQNQQTSEAQVLKTLEAQGGSWRDYFLLGEGDSVSICRFVPGSGMMALLIEDDGLARACKAFLVGKGVEHLATFEDVKKRFAWNGEFRMPKSNETSS